MRNFGKRGGDGPNTGKKAATFECTAPDGTKLKRRFFGTRQQVVPEQTNVVAALLPPSNGYSWSFWAVAETAETMPDYVLKAYKTGRQDSPVPILVEAKRVR